jgi:hypothetical protein
VTHQRSSPIEGVDPADLHCLILWPEGSRGWAKEERLITLLNLLCKEYGYGRVPQLAAAIEDIWRNPERTEHYRRQQADHLEFMEATMKSIREADNTNGGGL